jgi:hypothetical protein
MVEVIRGLGFKGSAIFIMFTIVRGSALIQGGIQKCRGAWFPSFAGSPARPAPALTIMRLHRRDFIRYEQSYNGMVRMGMACLGHPMGMEREWVNRTRMLSRQAKINNLFFPENCLKSLKEF